MSPLPARHHGAYASMRSQKTGGCCCTPGRGGVNEAHGEAVTGALAASAHVLSDLSERGELSPEQLADTAAKLDTGMRHAVARAMESLRADLVRPGGLPASCCAWSSEKILTLLG